MRQLMLERYHYMTTKISLLEAAVQRYNHFQGRLADQMADLIYYTKKVNLTKPDTQERVNAKTAVNDARLAIENDKVLVEAFAELITNLEKKGK